MSELQQCCLLLWTGRYILPHDLSEPPPRTQPTCVWQTGFETKAFSGQRARVGADKRRTRESLAPRPGTADARQKEQALLARRRAKRPR